MSWLENEQIKLGIDLERGGAITFLASPTDGANVINNHDLGRQVQLSFYSGPVPFESNGQKPAAHWRHIGWNPIQSGDDFDNPSRILQHHNDGRRIHLVCQPMQWPLNNVPGDCTFESWLELDGPVVKGRARLNNARSDRTLYPARLQELPAVYVNAAFHRVISYQGDRPFTQAAATPIPPANKGDPWSFWVGTEGWSALLNESDWGLGLVTPGRIHFSGGLAGQPGPNDTRGRSTAYVASVNQEVLDADIVYEFAYELVLGSLEAIRQRAAHWRPKQLPTWTFTRDRQGWHHHHLGDAGWPISDHLELLFEADDPQLVSPFVFWRAEDARHLIIEAAFSSGQTRATLFWQPQSEHHFTPEYSLTFPIRGDGTFHRYEIPLADHPRYQGTLVRLRIDPVDQAEPGSWLKLRRVELTR